MVTDKCAVSDDGKTCWWVETRCPIGINITINGTISDLEIALILAIIADAGSVDITIHKEVLPNGIISIVIYVNQDLLPESKTAADFNKDVQDELANFGFTGAEVSVIDDGSGNSTTTSSGMTTATSGTTTTTATSGTTTATGGMTSATTTTTATGTGMTTTKSDAKLVICSLLFVFIMLFI